MAAIVLAKITPLSISDHPLSIYTSLMQGFYSVAVCDPSSVGGRHPLRRHRIRGEIETAWSVELSEVRRRSCVQHYLTKRPANTSGSGSRVDIASNHSYSTRKLLNTLALACPQVPHARLADSSFWFLLYRPLFLTPAGGGGDFSGMGIGADVLYDSLLPGLNGRPFASNGRMQSLRWQSPPISGDVSCGWCVSLWQPFLLELQEGALESRVERE